MRVFVKAQLELVFIIGFVLAVSSAAIAANVPKLDVERTCREEPKMLPEDPDPYPECIREEREAREELQKTWGTFKPRHREDCVTATHIGGAPSYVDVLGCLQMTQ